jgi:hypothetical protein
MNGAIKFKVLKYNLSPMFHHPMSSDDHDIIPKPSLISIDVDCIRYKCFSFLIDVHKSVAIALLHTI